MKRTRGSLGLGVSNSSFPTGAPSNFDSGGDKLIDFLIDTGATYAVVNTKVAEKTSQSILVMGVSGQVQNRSFLQPLECQLGDLTLKHSFLYMPACPTPLLGRDLLCKLNVQVTFSPQQPDIRVPLKHILSLQRALMDTPVKETQPFPLRGL